MNISDNLLQLGLWLKEWDSCKTNNTPELNKLTQLIHNVHVLNNWHSEESSILMIQHLANLLSKEKLSKWTDLKDIHNEKRPAVLVKPNINNCFSGIHEWLCCVITNTPFVLSANENQFQLIKFFSSKLIEYDIRFKDQFDIGPKNTIKPEKYIIYSENNNSIMQYFKDKKALIIEDLPTIGILTGEETQDDLYNLGKDIFLNLGQSSATLRKIYIPNSFDIKVLIEAIEPFSYVYQNNKYANNYDYHQSVFLMERIEFLDNGFLIIKEDPKDDAPTGCLFYEYYSDIETVVKKISHTKYENLICAKELPLQTTKPGRSHFRELWDYPNHANMINFVLH